MLLLPPAVLLAEVQHSSAPPQQFPGSRIVSKANWGALWDPPYHPDGYPPLPGSGKKKSLNGWAKKPEAQVWALCYSSFTDNHDNPDAFHKQCDKHSSTMLFLKNARNFTFGAYANASWDPDACCATSRRDECFCKHDCSNASDPGGMGDVCYQPNTGMHNCGCIDRTAAASGDFIFRLSPFGGEAPGAGPVQKVGPQVFRTGDACWNCGGDSTEFQILGGWPQWGHFDLIIGMDAGPLGGTWANCLQGGTYAGHEDDACGGDSNWGHTDMEAWYPVGGK